MIEYLENCKVESKKKFDELESERQTLIQRVNQITEELTRLQGEYRILGELIEHFKSEVKSEVCEKEETK